MDDGSLFQAGCAQLIVYGAIWRGTRVLHDSTSLFKCDVTLSRNFRSMLHGGCEKCTMHARFLHIMFGCKFKRLVLAFILSLGHGLMTMIEVR